MGLPKDARQSPALDSDIGRRLEAAMRACDEAARTVLSQIAEDISSLHADLQELAPQEITGQRIPAAGEELEAVVAATESATHEIMQAAEVLLESCAEADGEFAKKVEDSATRIFEACTFQDITGQRIGKVIKTLKLIEDRLNASGIVRLAEAIGAERAKVTGAVSDDPPLEGPALREADGLKQTDIDSLLDELF
ncbi:protein phosphatase CheZ [Tepidamorphus sp. 3E244]|uniref:protein phosphatase CheZ n=1 Tax=Tepidamorphus sp. 3E244 TaxID=3385498 RepID=UPI0038FCE4F4